MTDNYEFYNSCLEGDLENMIKIYNTKKLDLRAYNDLALRYAVKSGKYECFRQILEWNPVILNFISLKTLYYCLESAVKRGNLRIMLDILDVQGKNVNLDYNNNVLLYWACYYGYMDIIDYLLNNFNKMSKNGLDDIIRVCVFKDREIVFNRLVEYYNDKDLLIELCTPKYREILTRDEIVPVENNIFIKLFKYIFRF
jgi:hypothetical protein